HGRSCVVLLDGQVDAIRAASARRAARARSFSFVWTDFLADDPATRSLGVNMRADVQEADWPWAPNWERVFARKLEDGTPAVERLRWKISQRNAGGGWEAITPTTPGLPAPIAARCDWQNVPDDRVEDYLERPHW